MASAVHFAWATPSSQGTTTYESVLYTDGSTSCSCPGWTFQRRGKPRTCRHVSKDMPDNVKLAQTVLLRTGTGLPRPATRIEGRITATPRSMPVEVARPGERMISRE